MIFCRLSSGSTAFLTDTGLTETLNQTAEIVELPPVIYKTPNANDNIQVWGSVNSLPYSGDLKAVQAEIVAVYLNNLTS